MKDAIVAVLIILIICLFGASTIFISYLEGKQSIVAYQTAYTKNLECRGNRSASFQVMDAICGAIPKFEDYQQ